MKEITAIDELLGEQEARSRYRGLRQTRTGTDPYWQDRFYKRIFLELPWQDTRDRSALSVDAPQPPRIVLHYAAVILSDLIRPIGECTVTVRQIGLVVPSVSKRGNAICIRDVVNLAFAPDDTMLRFLELPTRTRRMDFGQVPLRICEQSC